MAALAAAVALLLVVVVVLAALLARRPAPHGSCLRLGDMEMKLVHGDPVIRVVDGFLTPEECEGFIRSYEGQLRPSTVADDKDNSINRPNPSRTSWTAFLPPGQGDDLISRAEQRAVLLAGKPLRHMETLQLVRYKPPGEFYGSHFDFFHNDPESQRTVTIFVYLNTLDEAPTRFTRLGLDVEPVVGRACIWDNSPAHGRAQLADRRLEHAGMPVQKQTKFGLNIWFRSLPFRT